MLIDNTGQINEGSEKVLEVVFYFYSSLYRKETEDILLQKNVFQNIDKRLTSDDKEALDLALDKEVLFNALKELQSNTSPGHDSLTKEFDVYFWQEISPIYLKCIAEVKEK